jgi:short-subunit dehydrogenase
MSKYTGPVYRLTRQQQKALHKYFELLAKELNNNGITVQKLLSQAVELNWNARTIKELLWKPIQEALLAKKSTTELDKVKDIDEVWEHINRFVGETWGLYVPFPHRDPNDEAPTL